MSRQQNAWITEPDEAKLSLVGSFFLHAIAAGALATYFLLFTELRGNTWGEYPRRRYVASTAFTI